MQSRALKARAPTDELSSALPEREKLFEEMCSHPAHLIRRCFQIFQSGFEVDVGDKVITPVQWIVLATIYSFPGVDVTRLAGLAAVDKTSCSRAVAKLAERKLVQISPILEDLRQKRLSITPKGEFLIARALPGVRQLRTRLLEALTPQEQRNFMSALEIFVNRNNHLSRAPQRVLKSRGKPRGRRAASQY